MLLFEVLFEPLHTAVCLETAAGRNAIRKDQDTERENRTCGGVDPLPDLFGSVFCVQNRDPLSMWQGMVEGDAGIKDGSVVPAVMGGGGGG